MRGRDACQTLKALNLAPALRTQDSPTEKMREYLEVIYYLSVRNEPVIGGYRGMET
ncbi:MAG: hypothetical protein U0Z44_11470 [Kouleothrix sp.]